MTPDPSTTPRDPATATAAEVATDLLSASTRLLRWAEHWATQLKFDPDHSISIKAMREAIAEHEALALASAPSADAGLRRALEPFAKLAEIYASNWGDGTEIEVTLGDCRRAAAALAASPAPIEAGLADRLDKLQRFKDWVHAYLDAHGVPHHPPGTHGAEGCRIGDRMDWLMKRLAPIERPPMEVGPERAKMSELAIETLEQVLSECVSDAGSDDPQTHAPSFELLSKINGALAALRSSALAASPAPSEAGPMLEWLEFATRRLEYIQHITRRGGDEHDSFKLIEHEAEHCLGQLYKSAPVKPGYPPPTPAATNEVVKGAIEALPRYSVDATGLIDSPTGEFVRLADVSRALRAAPAPPAGCGTKEAGNG
jgi:hypothetical protein